MQTGLTEPTNDGSMPSVRHAWQAVLSGRYRIIDWYDREGRRYVVATKRTVENEPRCLTPREEKALLMRAAGSALKVIALELGVSLSTAARDLDRGMALLGLTTDADLAAVLGHVRT